MNPTLNILRDPITAKLEAIYARIPKIDCQRKCQIACGLISGEPAEEFRVIRQNGSGFGKVWINEDEHHPTFQHPYCEFLESPEGDCRIYALRPLMCRVFGVVRGLECPHGCIPGHWLDPAEVQALRAEIMLLNLSL